MIRRLAAEWRLLAIGLAVSVRLLSPALAAPAQKPSSSEVDVGDLSDLPLSPQDRLIISDATQAHEYAKAENALLVAAKSHGDDARFYEYLGRLFFVDQQYFNAMIAFKRADASRPINDRDRFTLAMAYISGGRPKWAEPELNKLAQANPREPLYVYWQGRLQYDRQDLKAAAVSFQKAILIDPQFMRAYDNLGLCLEGMGEDDEAIKQYQQAILINRRQFVRSVWPLVDLGTLLTKLGRPEEAQTFLSEALQSDPKCALAHLQLGLAFEEQNNQKLARIELRRAVELKPENAEAHYVLARVLRHLGDTKGSVLELSEYHRITINTHPQR